MTGTGARSPVPTLIGGLNPALGKPDSSSPAAVGNTYDSKLDPLDTSYTYGLTVANYSTPYVLSPLFYGVDVRADRNFTVTDAYYLNDTNVRTWRYPGGNLGEKINYTTNEEEPAGTPYVNSISNFISMCNLVHCHAILELPAEIDSPPTDGYYVNYIENVLHFTPAIWEIGNEPALYTNFKMPWSEWNQSGTNATAVSYAPILPAIISAIREFDPTTPISPFGGIGGGNRSTATWAKTVFSVIQDTAQYIDLHSYPVNSTTTVQGFYQSLYTNGGPYSSYPGVISAVLSVCPTCTNVRLQVTELGTTDRSANAGNFSSSFPAEMFDMTAVIQTSNPSFLVTSDEFYAFHDWVAGNQPSPLYYPFKDITPYLGSTAMNVSISGGADGNQLQVGAYWSAPDNWSMLLVNLDCTNAVHLMIAGSGFPVHGDIEVYNWTNATQQPVGSATNWFNSTSIPPNSMSLVTVSPPTPPPAPPAPVGPFIAAVGATYVAVSYVQPAGLIANDSTTYGTPSSTYPYCKPTTVFSFGNATAVINVTGLEPATAYCFAVQAWNSAGASPLSQYVNATTNASAGGGGGGEGDGGGGGGATQSGTVSPPSALEGVFAVAIVIGMTAVFIIDLMYQRRLRRLRP